MNVLALLRRAGRAACEAESVELATALQQLLVTCCQAGSFQTGSNTKPFQHLNHLNNFKHIYILDSGHGSADIGALRSSVNAVMFKHV